MPSEQSLSASLDDQSRIEDQSVALGYTMRKACVLPVQKCGWKVKEWAFATSISVSSTWALIAQGKVKSVKFGSSRIIVTPPQEFLVSLEHAS